MDPTRILFVCAGNICRSPLAEGIFRHLATLAGRAGDYSIDSAGTGGWHEGQRPDPRSIAVAMHHGIDISGQRARKIRAQDFHHFHVILGMDHDNLRNLGAIAAPSCEHRIHLFSRFATGGTEDVPDPYYGGRQGFEDVYTQLLAGCSAVLAKLEAERFS
ncbi:low molecular weight phosphotyrosine protein phosphatase [Rhizobiaceae bacterium n13]|uniref:protein-tyrosine-phosphatase n=1 Tax=Ferirhizobium litorale TaxID=2927786 RepID=A0AAE3QGT6_9HYPH|nr:low molecular weight protein-tyrosine-phosphatase [Fererhizobium litorale]MDI7862428.1 low molecular weight phosphotyrosine protein phosphatase [Fererhizobium litorale]MDI7923685.1 low molecular weight phosphotyrosine protein phosphatase [Fererhizobium litorale]